MQKESWKSRRQVRLGKRITADHKVLSEERIAIASLICGSGPGFGYPMEYTVILAQTQDCARDDESFAAILASRKQACSYLHGSFIEVHTSLPRFVVES